MATPTKPASRPHRSFQRDDPSERARQSAGEFAGNSKKTQKTQAEAETPTVSTARIEEWMGELSPSHLHKVKALIQLQVQAMGYQGGTREGSALWERVRNEVVSGMILHEADLDEIELGEEE